MKYNTEREKLSISEYGRHVQNMVNYLLTIEDREKRTESAKVVVSSMAQMNPNIKDSSDYLHILWDHLYIISDFKLDVDSPYPPPPKEKFEVKPTHLGYNINNIELRHYGKYIVEMVKKVSEFEPGEKKMALTILIANQMKKAYLMWNRESVQDAVIGKHLAELSKGKLILPEEVLLVSTGSVIPKPGKGPAKVSSNPIQNIVHNSRDNSNQKRKKKNNNNNGKSNKGKK